MQVVIVTGLSGAGKSYALRALEDYGFYCVDNLPVPMIRPLVDWLTAQGTVTELALSVDARQHQYLNVLRDTLEQMKQIGHVVDVLYLDASEECLVKRFSTTRRLHPLSGTDVVTGIRRDREIMSKLRPSGKMNAHESIVNTDQLNVHQLKAIIQARYGEGHLSVVLLSFGFKYGLPRDANLIFDVRFLRNPYFDDDLKELDGRDPRVASYVFDGTDEASGESANNPSEAEQLARHIEGLMSFSLPRFQHEGKLYLTVAVGCTGGRHRSVAMVEELHRRLSDEWDVLIKHRDLDLRT